MQKYDLPLIVHSGDGEYSNPDNMLSVIQGHPELRFMIAHLADFSRHFFDYIETHNLKNVFVDICPWY
jgi:predicted TIM-barrel fold metal-dependent hydrolase